MKNSRAAAPRQSGWAKPQSEEVFELMGEWVDAAAGAGSR